MAAILASGAVGFGTAPAQNASPGEVASTGGWLDDLLGDLEDATADSEDMVAGTEGPLPDPERSGLGAVLDEILAVTNQILDPSVEPNLTPADAGVIDWSLDPDGLNEYAAVCAALAEEAHAEHQAGDPIDYELIGTNLKTIEYLITRSSPHNYKSKAGL